jgi:soluble lytic murein transglycosylase
MKFTLILTLLSVTASIGLFGGVAHAQNRGDTALLEMHEAFRQKDGNRLSALLPQVRGHALEPLAAYWDIHTRLDSATESDIKNFLTTFAGTYYEDRLRNDWLLQLGKNRDWPTFTAQYPLFRMRDDREVRCYALVTALINKSADVADEALRLWYAQRDADDGCTHLVERLHSDRQIKSLDVWHKARLAMHANRPIAAQAAVQIAAPHLAKYITLIHANPERFLRQQKTHSGHGGQALAVLALTRLAARDPDLAADWLKKRGSAHLTQEERDWTWAVIGKHATLKLQDTANSHFAEVKQVKHLNDNLLSWQVRAALRQADWPQVLIATQAMSAESRNDPAWVYWRARALQATATGQAQKQEARQLLQQIASVRGFYEQLALEDLGQAIRLPERPAALTAQEKDAAQNHPGLQRALHAIAMGLRSQGNREWNYTTSLHTPGGMNDRELLAAADMACQREVWDRCIYTSERTKAAFDHTQRFPLPLQETVVRKAQDIQLDPAFVYGLIRQESRFIMDARSHVGASGLMQVMPATAKWTARKIGLTSFTPRQINDQEINVTIGTAYLKMVLDDFGASMPLAAAAYNAGPSRSRNWRNGPELEAAIWAENIPFQETRDYVKKVLSNTTNYAAILTGQPQSLKARLGTVGPHTGLMAAVNKDLP